VYKLIRARWTRHGAGRGSGSYMRIQVWSEKLNWKHNFLDLRADGRDLKRNSVCVCVWGCGNDSSGSTQGTTELCGRVVNSLASYSGRRGFKSWPGLETGYPDWRFSWFYLEANAGIVGLPYLKLVHDRFLPHLFNFIIHISLFHSRLLACFWERVVKYITNNIGPSDRLSWTQ
jgi:hypothetical protein